MLAQREQDGDSGAKAFFNASRPVSAQGAEQVALMLSGTAGSMPVRAHVEPNNFAVMAEAWANVVLVWIGYGTLVGLLAKAIMPGRDPGGAITTVAMGIGGSVIGCGILAFFWEGQRVTPISPLGFLVATGGSFLLLFFYRLLGGYLFVEGSDGHFHYRPHRRPVRRRVRRPVYETVTHEEDH